MKAVETENVFITDLLPILDLGRSNLDEDIVSPTNLECIVENKNYKLESQGYKVCHWYMYQSVYFCKQKKDQSFFFLGRNITWGLFQTEWDQNGSIIIKRCKASGIIIDF